MARTPKYPEYRDKLGNKVPSVTTIISRFKDSGPLLYWANKVGQQGLTLDQAREPAATAGTMAHALVEAHLRGDEMPTLIGDLETIEKARAAFEGYKKWEDTTKLEFRHVEVPLVSERYRFGGRIDAIGVMGNQLVLCDFKTSGGIYVDYTLQCAAYGQLWSENYEDHPLEGGYYILRFAKEEGDFSTHHFPKLERELVAFLKMRELYDLMKDCEKRTK